MRKNIKIKTVEIVIEMKLKSWNWLYAFKERKYYNNIILFIVVYVAVTVRFYNVGKYRDNMIISLIIIFPLIAGLVVLCGKLIEIIIYMTINKIEYIYKKLTKK